jgi:hypothetical protein
MPKRIIQITDRLEIAEYPPQTRLIATSLRPVGGGDRVQKKYYVNFPYMQFGYDMKKNALYSSATIEPLESMDSPLLMPLLPNIFDDLSVYFPQLPIDCLDTALDAFWLSEFSDRDKIVWPGYEKLKELGGFEKWQNITKGKANPLFYPYPAAAPTWTNIVANHPKALTRSAEDGCNCENCRRLRGEN